MTSKRSSAEPSSPTRKQPIDDAAYWLDRADEITAIVEDMKDPDARLMMLELAETYKTMAERAYRRAKAN